ncbi:hypothetical protein [Actinophytocola sp.]|uniref:hypothetical protein n=1 Tax=Actinophytocola sp. TaxID=1872138 RepID=UPI00389AC2D0
MTLMSDRQAARTIVATVVTTVRRRGWARAAGYLRSRIAADPEPRDRLRCVLTELIELNAALALRRMEPLDGTELISLDLADEDESPIDIDSLAPAVRAFLARVNGHPADADEQVHLALLAPPPAVVDAVMIILGWTTDQLDWCRHHRMPTPEWLGAA